MVRSGLQKDVINLYRQGVRAAFSKSVEERPAFLLHLRWNFHHPPLSPRDYSAIEHQLRKMSRVIEMISDPGVKRMGLSGEMSAWWEEELSRRSEDEVAAANINTTSSPSSESSERRPVRSAGSSAGNGNGLNRGRDEVQWGGKLPGHGGT